MAYDASKDTPILDSFFGEPTEETPTPAKPPTKKKRAKAIAPAEPTEVPDDPGLAAEDDRLDSLTAAFFDEYKKTEEAQKEELPVIEGEVVVVPKSSTASTAIVSSDDAVILPSAPNLGDDDAVLDHALDSVMPETLERDVLLPGESWDDPLPEVVWTLLLDIDGAPVWPGIANRTNESTASDDKEPVNPTRVFTGLNIYATDKELLQILYGNKLDTVREEQGAPPEWYLFGSINNSVSRFFFPTKETPTIFGVSNYAAIKGSIAGTMGDFDYRAYTRFIVDTYLGTPWDEQPQTTAVSTEKYDYSAPHKRPNDELYYPRKVSAAIGRGANKELVYDLQLIHRSYLAGLPVLLYGEPGTGKTAACEAILPDLITIPGNGDTEVADFVGSYVQLEDGTYFWVDGPLLEAMDQGRPLLIDEIALIDPRVMAVGYSVMDGRGELRVTANPRRGVVKAKPGFYIIGACNPDVPGAVMSEALLSRFVVQIEYTTDYDMLHEHLGVPSDIVTAAKNLAKKRTSGEVMKAPETRDLLAYNRIRSIHGDAVALANLVGAALPNDRSVYKEVIDNTFGKSIVPLATQD